MTPNRETLEKRQHSTTWMPYSYYECRLPEWFASVPVHWHGEFELIHIKQGRGGVYLWQPEGGGRGGGASARAAKHAARRLSVQGAEDGCGGGVRRRWEQLRGRDRDTCV